MNDRFPASTPPFAIGHRGVKGRAPENTLSAFRKAAEMNLHWVEFDTMLSADDQIIIFHDDKLERITGAAGLTADHSLAELRELDAGAGEKIPTLDETFALLEQLQLGAVVEIKPSHGRGVETGQQVASAVNKHWPTSLPTPILSSFDLDSLAQARQHAPDVPRALNLYKGFQSALDKMAEYDCVALHCKQELVDEKFAASITGAGYELRCFTVDDPRRAEKLRSWGVVSVFTDYPDRLFNSQDTP